VPRAAELAELDDDELENRLREYRRELLNLRFQIATSQLDNSSRLSAVRKDIARVMTLIREREIALAEGRELIAAVAHPRPVYTPEEPEELEEEELQEADAFEDSARTVEPEELEDEELEDAGLEDEDLATTVEPEEVEDEELEDEELDEGAEFGDETDLPGDEGVEEDEEGSEEPKEVDG
jgi:large subunit ribosomal protein L29